MRLFPAALAALVATAFGAGAGPIGALARAQEEGESGEQQRSEEDLQAEAELRAALEKDPKNVAANVALGQFLYERGYAAEGLALLWRAVGLDAKDEGAATALIDDLLQENAGYAAAGDTMNADAQVARAAKILADFTAAGGADSKATRIRRVRVFSLLPGKEAEGYAAAKKLLTDEPADETLHVLFVEAATAAKQFEDGLDFYAKGPFEPWLSAWFTSELHVGRAHMYFNRYTDDEKTVQDYLEAEQLVLQSGRLHPQVFAAASERASRDRAWRGWTRLRQDRYDEAWDLFVSAWGRDPKNDNAIGGLRYLGDRLYESGELEKARELYRQACVIAPDRVDFWNNYALICRDCGHYEESYRAYLRAVALAPDDPRTINDCYLILLYHLHRDLDLAEREFIRAEDLVRAQFTAAQQGDDEGALASTRSVLGDVLVNLARLYSEQGRMQEAGEHWNELRAVDPGRPELPENGAEPPPQSVPPPKDPGAPAKPAGGGR
jgi:tetratricopeptide (TPR) repeat protein